MAVLRRQAVFAQGLYQSGAVDEGEREAILDEVGRRERQLELTGGLQALGWDLDFTKGVQYVHAGHVRLQEACASVSVLVRGVRVQGWFTLRFED